jgi:diguanylate cyclase (GGDEF)-like protein
VWAWDQLELQDMQSPTKEINWKPIWRFEENSGSGVLRFLYADPGTSDTCISCHNAHEKTAVIEERRKNQHIPVGKTWEKNQLLGALSITVPLDGVKRVSSDQVNKTTILLTNILSLLFLIVFLFYHRNKIQQFKIRSLDWKANHDPLTELLNRRGFEEKYRVHKDRHVTNAIICFIDLDKFKSVNDVYGHNVGDHLLKTIALNLSNAVESTDYIIRLGGDEFAAVLFNVLKEHEQAIGERLLAVINDSKVHIDTSVISVSASIGIGTFNPITSEYSDFLDQADKASYQAKQNGCNREVIRNA